MKNKIKIIIFSIIGIACIALSFIFDNIIQDLMKIIQNTLFGIIFGWITHFGSLFVVLVLMTSLFMWREKKFEWIPAIWLSLFSSIASVFILKQIFARGRPLITETYPLINILNYSFPSMHAAAAFAVIPILDKEFPRLKWFWIAFAVLVGLSRLYFNVHYFSDVIAGAFIGYAIGWLFVKTEEKHMIFIKILERIGIWK